MEAGQRRVDLAAMVGAWGDGVRTLSGGYSRKGRSRVKSDPRSRRQARLTRRDSAKVQTPRRLPPVSSDLDLSVILPANNEGRNLQVLLPQLRAVLQELGIGIEVLVEVRGLDTQTQAAVEGGLATIIRQREPGHGGGTRPRS